MRRYCKKIARDQRVFDREKPSANVEGKSGSIDGNTFTVEEQIEESDKDSDLVLVKGEDTDASDTHEKQTWNDTNDNEVVVAVCDTGVDYEHPDLQNMMWNHGLEYSTLKSLGGSTYGINTSGEGASNNPSTLYVGAMDSKGEKAEFSNYGKKNVDVFAPGTNILAATSTQPNNTNIPGQYIPWIQKNKLILDVQ